MTSSVDGKNYSYYLCFVAAGVILTTGLMTQIFIVAVNILDRWKGRPVTITDGIITCLGVLRAVYLLACFFVVTWKYFFKMDPTTLNIFHFFHMVLSSANIWLSTFLAVVFCLKISSFHCDFFLHLRMVIFRRSTRVISVCALISVGYESVDFWIRYIKLPDNSTTLFEHFKSDPGDIKQLKIAHVCLIISWNVVLIILHCFSSIALITSLCLHVKKMKNVTSCLDAHYRALRFTIFSLVGCILHINITLSKRYMINYLGFTWAFIIMNVYPTLHSIYLICTSSKLRPQFLQILSCTFMNSFNGREEQHTTQVETIIS